MQTRSELYEILNYHSFERSWMNYFQRTKRYDFMSDARLGNPHCWLDSEPNGRAFVNARLTAKNPERQHNENRRQRRDDRACDCGGKRPANDTGRNRTTTHPATRRKCSPNCTNPHTTATRCLSYRTTHSYLPRSSQPDSSAGTHRYSLQSRSNLPVRFQSLPPFRSNYQLQAAGPPSAPLIKPYLGVFLFRRISAFRINPTATLHSWSVGSL